jgi:hypothetical protein
MRQAVPAGATSRCCRGGGGVVIGERAGGLVGLLRNPSMEPEQAVDISWSRFRGLFGRH